MNKMPINQIVFGKTDAFNELNTFGQDYFVGSFVSNPKYHVDEFISGSRYFICENCKCKLDTRMNKNCSA